jgi:hypothetical protein
VSTLKQCIDRLIVKHGGLRAAARASGLDAGYLSRLQSGSKEHPSERTLRALGIESRISYVMSRQKPRPFERMTVVNATAYHSGEDDGL